MEFRKRKRIKIIIKNEINQPVVAFILVCWVKYLYQTSLL
jgi:hypothetical protein